MQKRTLYQSGKFYKGNLHTHTTRSDGSSEPEETAKRYRQEGNSFLAITDHWVYGVHEELNRKICSYFPVQSWIWSFLSARTIILWHRSARDEPDSLNYYRFERERTGNTLCTP